MRTLSSIFASTRSLAYVASLTLAGATSAPFAADAADISALFGSRVHAASGAPTRVWTGDFDGDGVPDVAYLVSIDSDAVGKTIAADVHVVNNAFGGKPLQGRAAAHAIAISLKRGAAKFLVVDSHGRPGDGMFDTPLWSNPAQSKSADDTPLRVAKHGDKSLAGYACHASAKTRDMLMLMSEAGIEVALAWTGASFLQCVDPTAEP